MRQPMMRGNYVPDISDIANIAPAKLETCLISGKGVWEAAAQEFLGADCRQSIYLRLPYWLDEKLRSAAADVGMSPQEVLRYLLADMLGGPKPGWLDRRFGRRLTREVAR